MAPTGTLAKKILATRKTGKAIHEKLKTDERVLARITEGIYRQPSSALRELISNAYDADASEVTIITDAPRFAKVIVRDNGIGLQPAALENLIQHIGASAKGSKLGAKIGVTDARDNTKSKGGRKLIGRMGIGLFSVAQLTRHFQIITKTAGTDFRTIADITLNMQSDGDATAEYDAGSAKIWTEPAIDKDSHGTEILLLDLRKTTRDELASRDLWQRVEAATDAQGEGGATVSAPRYHIGRVSEADVNTLDVSPNLPWADRDSPRERFQKLVQCVFDEVGSTQSTPSLEITFDKYLRLLWTLSLAPPLDYVDGHPFDQRREKSIRTFQIPEDPKEQAEEVHLKKGESLRDKLELYAPDQPAKNSFVVQVDGVQLFRPLRFSSLPATSHAIDTPLLFVGSYRPDLSHLPDTVSGGPLSLEAYLFWAPLVVPTEHRGVLVRIGDASGTPFDPHFMGYQVSEQTRLRQLTAEVFVRQGLDNAINIDRESFNFAHPHYQLIVKWLHAAIKRFTNKHKEIGRELRESRLGRAADEETKRLRATVSTKLKQMGVRKPAEVILLDDDQTLEAVAQRKEGKIVLSKDVIFQKASDGPRGRKVAKRKNEFADERLKAAVQILHAWGVFEGMTYSEQQQFVRDLLEVLRFGNEL